MGATEIKITLNRDGIIQPATSTMLTVNSSAAVAIRALETADMNDLPWLGSFRVEPELNTEDLRRAQCLQWILTKGIEDIAGAVRSALEEAFLYISIGELAGTAKTWGQFEEGRAAALKKRQTLNFPDLLAAVEGKLTGELSMKEEMKSLQRVRNCLVHRNRIVGPSDCDSGTEVLTARLPYLQFTADLDGESKELAAGMFFPGGTEITIKLAKKDRVFPLGSVISFEVEDFNEITASCFYFATDVANKLPQYGPVTS